MYKILTKEKLTTSVGKMIINAPLVSKNALPGQFIILRVSCEGERIPLTIFEAKEGTITIIYQVVGATTRLLDELEAGDYLCDVVGPLGEATNLNLGKNIIVIAGGLGCAIAYPLVKKMSKNGLDVTSIIGFRSKDLVILANEFANSSKEFYLVTDDGSLG